MPALDRYDGYFYKIIKKAIRDGALGSTIDICILSAEHGLLDPDDQITLYDRQMDIQRAKELRTEVISALRKKIRRGDYNRVIVNMGSTYRYAIDGFEDELDVEVSYIEGGGIGEKGHKLKQFLRTDEPSKVQA